ncbi:kinesin-like protein KIN-7E isoform X2 [Olea europaea var. sylvestris]|uniref:kinesin-like protein KIN-7E isoform X2 n=1 Tax=Olea europaea var. sylvestris TaxID=158386 RepID=UPI000C1D293F|nr:kinesin-like protein KIN-7E isoform X2 [Olea europaea var. sylvestris]
MGAFGGEELMNWEKMQVGGNGKEENILVLVRLRPLGEKEIAQDEVTDWECINSTTILYRNSLQERSGLPTSYSFDRVFRGDCSTREVYEEGAKDIALSVVGGINSTIFAYGQTSSGKTYTMNGITEYAVADIYDYIQRHEERAFVLKFSAMEIYNEVVKDLLSGDNNPLRLLDEPERGTIIEKLTEETLRDWSHLKELLSICEAQRQIGETSLNETSSRSHQILRLTIESSAREFLGKDNSATLSASVNFVDLAGSERASQSLSVGQRLKEGCHINRSLLTLGTVIRKLSKGRHGHVNYRDSKLTRILQPALGGNGRTTIICTLSPARCHVEQSRNTLLFASCAKEVTTNAQVNVVMSDKALVKHLQKEVARLESELRTPGLTCDHAALLRKKDLQIEKLEKEIKELTRQRDLARSRVQELLQEDALGCPPKLQGENTCEDVYPATRSLRLTNHHDRKVSSRKLNKIQSHNKDIKSDARSDQLRSEDSEDHSSSYAMTDLSQGELSQGRDNLPVGANENSGEVCKEVRCIEMDKDLSNSENDGSKSALMEFGSRCAANPVLSLDPDVENGYIHGKLEHKMQDEQNTMVSLASTCEDRLSPSINILDSGNLKLTSNGSYKPNLVTGSPDFEMAEEIETTPPPIGMGKSFPGRPEGFQRKNWMLPPSIYGANGMRLSRSNSQSSYGSSFPDEVKAEDNFHGDEDIPTLGSFAAGLREMVRLQNVNKLDDQVQQPEIRAQSSVEDELDARHDSSGAPSNWLLKFERLRGSIIELWQACNVSLVHRTYFFLLFKGDLADSIYMEVEHRRLLFLKETFSEGNLTVQDGHALTLASSMKTLRREREMLSKLIYKRYTEDERNKIYERWGIKLNSKRRRLQLVHHLWIDTKDMNHVSDSAAIVAKLIGFSEQGEALKEMFGLSFTPPRMSRRSISWKNSMTSLL